VGFPFTSGCRRTAMVSSAYARAKAVGEIVAGASEVSAACKAAKAPGRFSRRAAMCRPLLTPTALKAFSVAARSEESNEGHR
jgi:hypothetical protein